MFLRGAGALQNFYSAVHKPVFGFLGGRKRSNSAEKGGVAKEFSKFFSVKTCISTGFQKWGRYFCQKSLVGKSGALIFATRLKKRVVL